MILLRCSECRVQFRWDTKHPWPKFCPECGFDTSLPPGDEPAMPFISLHKNRSADDVYRAMERGSEFRQEKAAEALGVHKSELNDMKITNLNSTYREGDVAAPPVPQSNPVQAAINAQPNLLGFQRGGSEFSGPVASGPFPNAGAHTQQMVRQMHSRYAPGGMSEMPANEVMQPGYRRRV